MTVENLLTFFVLLLLEMVLSVDNIVFISVNIEGLEKKQRQIVLFYGLSLAIIIRIIMLFCYNFISHIEKPLIADFSVASIVLIIGGAFLIFKSIKELHKVFCYKTISDVGVKKRFGTSQSILASVMEIIFIDFVFSVDSILAAVAITKNFLIIAVVFFINVVFMGLMSKITMHYITKFSSIKIVGLIFITIVGAALVLEGIKIDIPKVWIMLLLGLGILFAPLIQRFMTK